jgi:DNA-directed RNA polymerase specialized sigma24 family protein
VAARKYRGDGAPASAWLVGIARNTLFSSLRRSRVVSLDLVPIERKQRTSASLSQGRVLAGMTGGFMRIYFLLH